MYNFTPDQYRTGRLFSFGSEAYAEAALPNVQGALRVLLLYWARLASRAPLPKAPTKLDAASVVKWASEEVLAEAYLAENDNAPKAGVLATMRWVPIADSFDGTGRAEGYGFVNELELWWRGTFTPGRWVKIVVKYHDSDQPPIWRADVPLDVEIAWDSATGGSSYYLNINGLDGLIERLNDADCLFGIEVAAAEEPAAT